jgi:hypothetical protein
VSVYVYVNVLCNVYINIGVSYACVERYHVCVRVYVNINGLCNVYII